MRRLIYLIIVAPGARRLRYHAALVMYLAIIGIGSVPGARSELGHVASGIALHSLAYATLALLLFAASGGPVRRRASRTVVTVMAMGALDELIQSALPYRTAAVFDWVIDCSAGLLTCTFLWRVWPVNAREC